NKFRIMKTTILTYLKSKLIVILLISFSIAFVFFGASFLFQKLYKTEVYCYSNVFDNVHNKSVFQSFNSLIGSGNIEEIQALTNMKPEIIEQVNQVDFFEILSEENNYFKLSMISKTNKFTEEFLDGITYYYENGGINSKIFKSELNKINSKIDNKKSAVLKIDSIYDLMNSGTNVIIESNLEQTRNNILNELEEEKIKLETNKGLNIVNEPFAPLYSYFPNRIIFAAFGLIIGFILALLYFVLSFELKEQQ
ncbi:MAG: hypothetical protein ACPGVH_08655, partial [Chitinophagales bacterium]